MRDLTDQELNRALAEAKLAETKAKKLMKDAQREFLRRHGKVVGTEVDMGGIAVSLQVNHRFNADLAQQVLTPEELEQISVSKPDSKRAAEVLDPERFELCMKKSDPKFGIGLGFN